MKEQNVPQSSENIEQQSSTNAQPQIPNIDDIAVVEYLEIVRSEYETERNKNKVLKIVLD